MAETVNYPTQNQMGCGFMSLIFQRRISGQRKSTGKPFPAITKHNSTNLSPTHDKSAKTLPKKDGKPSIYPISVSPRPSKSNQQNSIKRPSDAARNSTSSSSNSSGLRRDSTLTTSGDMSLTTEALNRAPSGNIMVLAQLGKQNLVSSTNSPRRLSSNKNIGVSLITGNNMVRKTRGEISQFGNIYKGLMMNKLDPEVVKSMGNEKYNQGRFEEALVLYNQAISIDPNKASYYSNKGAALIGLGRLIEAVFECAEAVRIEPCYHRAHHRLASLYLRLGEPEKALHHYRHSGFEAGSDEITKSQTLKKHLNACTKASEMRDWQSLLKESQSAISCGADSAPQMFAMKVEALLKADRQQEAYETFQKGPSFDTDSYCRLFGEASCAYVLTIRAQVYLIAGRFEDAVAAAQQATRLATSPEPIAVMNRVQAVAISRSNGNQFFKSSRFSEAIVAYSEGLQHDRYNSILMCNRAACRFKLGQFEKAAEDCSAALNVRPSYGKARLRRANCYAKMEKWVAAIQDYEMLFRETPGDEELAKALLEARSQLNKQHSEETIDIKSKPRLEDSRQ